MKKIIFSLLVIATMASCSKNNGNTNNGDHNGMVPIRLNSGIELTTKAPIEGSAEVNIGCWESSGAAVYTEATTWISTSTVNVAASGAEIVLAPARYYNADNTIKSHLKGWYPAGTFNAGMVGFTNTDGSVDAIISNGVSGSKGTVVASDLTFEHITAQLKFKVLKGEGLADGTKIKSIKVKGAKLPTAINLSKLSTEADVATWTDVDVNGLAVSTLVEAEITGTPAQDAGVPMMIQPVGDNTTIKLDVITGIDGATDVTFSDIAVSTDGDVIERGKAYTITLTFTQAGITPKASITDWTTAEGAGTVQ